MSESDHSGFLNVDKPLRYTSHDIVALARRRYRALTGAKKVGHAGTLDPLASGVLVLCLGKATRLSEYIMPGLKSYRASVAFGRASSTYDSGGELEPEQADTSGITLAKIQAALSPFIGDIKQTPPMYSAIKVGGRKLYELARQGQTIERAPRPVRIDSIKILAWHNPLLELDIVCSAGAYMRSLAHDLGQALGVGAYLSGLQRRASGQFALEDSVTLDTVLNEADWWQRIIPPRDALARHRCVTLSAAELSRIQTGRAIARRCRLNTEPDEEPNENPNVEPIFAFTGERQLAAVLLAQGELWKPHKVFT